jgi:hypothetical protein
MEVLDDEFSLMCCAATGRGGQEEGEGDPAVMHGGMPDTMVGNSLDIPC